MIKQYQNSLLSVLLLMFIISGTCSCVKENLGECPDDRVRVQLQLDVEAVRTGGTGNYGIDAVRLYVFDTDDSFVTMVEGGAYVSGEDYFLYPEIGPGRYSFVVWTNIGDHYKTSHSAEECQNDTPLFSDMHIYLDYAEDGCVYTHIPDLHHGILSEAEVVKYGENHFTVVLMPNTNLLNFSVEGLDETTDDYGFTIDDDNSRYKFDNSFGDCTGLRYIRTSRFDAGGLCSTLKTLRLTEDREPVFLLTNDTTGETLFTDNLVEMIMRAYASAGITVDFETTHTFDIVIRFDVNMNVTVTVNGWNYTITPGELG